MIKRFDEWNEQKKRIDSKSNASLFYEREVWWSIIGTNIGVESDGKHENFLRPVLIMRKFNMHMMIGLPTTSKDKPDMTYYKKCKGKSGKEYMLCLSQLKATSSKRLLRKIDTVSRDDYEKILEVTAKMIRTGLTNNETSP